MSSFADFDVIKMDYIGSVADILGPDPSMPEDSITMDELPELKIGEERNEVDGQSFANVEDYVSREESESQLMATNDLEQFNGWEKKLQQLTPPLSPPSPTTPRLLHSEIPTSKDSAVSSTNKVFSDLSVAPGTSMDKELAIHEQLISQEEFEEEILSLITKEEEVGPQNIISTADSSENAISAVSVPPLEGTRQATKNFDAVLMESKEMSTCSASRKRKKYEEVPFQVPNIPKVNVDAVVVYEDAYQEEYGKFIKISIIKFDIYFLNLSNRCSRNCKSSHR